MKPRSIYFVLLLVFSLISCNQETPEVNDISIISPVFYKNRLFGFVANVAHHADIGGKAPGGGAA